VNIPINLPFAGCPPIYHEIIMISAMSMRFNVRWELIEGVVREQMEGRPH
jgi:hypothetical protein